MAKDYYKILGVEKSASAEEIKKAFRQQAHKHHPDKAGGDESKFKELNEAYQVLSNPQKRQQYDQFGQTFNQAGGGQGGGFGGFDFSEAFRNGGGQGASFDFDLGDLFGDFFGGGQGRSRSGRRSARGADMRVEMDIDFKEAVFGAEKQISLDKEEACSRCKGKGNEPGTKVTTCSTCKGTGQVVRNMGFGIGFPSVCPECNGQGETAEKKCKDCDGDGTQRRRSDIRIKIPAGIDDGQTIRLVGRGEAGPRGSQAGDLYIIVNVRKDRNFDRQGYDILTKSDISFSQAALGDKIEVDTIDGAVKLKIPEGTQSGKVFRIKGKGVNHLQGKGRGDQLVTVVVKTPQGLSRQEKDLLKKLKDFD